VKNILAISGSLRSASTNTALLEATALLAASDMRIELYPDIGKLPHFNSDLDDELQQQTPQLVWEFRDRVAHADGLLISCPEYARGNPGSFKNALVWLVGCPLFSNTPVSLYNASPRERGTGGAEARS